MILEGGNMYVICNPTIFEIQEMLDCIAKSKDINKYFPQPENESRAEHLHNGICLLFYDDNYRPLAYCAFLFSKPKANPFFCAMATEYITWQQMLAIRKALIRFADNEFKRGVSVYILNDAVIPLVETSGFKQSKRNKKIYFRRK